MCLAVPGEVLDIEDNTATVEINGVKQEARLDTIADSVQEGDYLLVHTGFAIRKIPPEEAQKTLQAFDELIEANQELEEQSEI